MHNCLSLAKFRECQLVLCGRANRALERLRSGLVTKWNSARSQKWCGVFPQHIATEGGDTPCRDSYQPAHWPREGFQTPVTLSDEVVGASCYSKLFQFFLCSEQWKQIMCPPWKPINLCLIKALHWELMQHIHWKSFKKTYISLQPIRKDSLKTDEHFYIFDVLNMLDAFTKGKECTGMQNTQGHN